MKIIKTAPHKTDNLPHAERIRRCADLGQITLRAGIDKKKVRTHYEGVLAELHHETRAHAQAPGQ